MQSRRSWRYSRLQREQHRTSCRSRSCSSLSNATGIVTDLCHKSSAAIANTVIFVPVFAGHIQSIYGRQLAWLTGMTEQACLQILFQMSVVSSSCYQYITMSAVTELVLMGVCSYEVVLKNGDTKGQLMSLQQTLRQEIHAKIGAQTAEESAKRKVCLPIVSSVMLVPSHSTAAAALQTNTNVSLACAATHAASKQEQHSVYCPDALGQNRLFIMLAKQGPCQAYIDATQVDTKSGGCHAR